MEHIMEKSEALARMAIKAAMSELYTAMIQRAESDDKIISEHISKAYDILQKIDDQPVSPQAFL